ncbi:MAG: hypothetical protein R3A11_07380 [Bdellovibrionota bacterium]
MAQTTLPVDQYFDFSSVLMSHGWSSLQPFQTQKDRSSIQFALRGPNVVVKARMQRGKLLLESSRKLTSSHVQAIKKIFGLQKDMNPFYQMASRHDRSWIVELGMGRLLTSQTVFEDLIKLILTTNCSWSFTTLMVNRLCEHAGEEVKGHRLFPTAQELAKKPQSFYQNKIRCGYRGPHVKKISQMVTSGQIDPESWPSDGGADEVLRKEILRLPGVGPYVVDNLMRFMGRYQGLGVDSWVRGQLKTMWKTSEAPSDKDIKSKYEKYSPFQGLVLWCDVTQSWFDQVRSTRGTKF